MMVVVRLLKLNWSQGTQLKTIVNFVLPKLGKWFWCYFPWPIPMEYQYMNLYHYFIVKILVNGTIHFLF